MSQLPAKVPTVALAKLVGAGLASELGSELRDGDELELVIDVEDRDLNVRELAAFLTLLDRVYGRALFGDLRYYARDDYNQLRLREVRQGSLRLILDHLLASQDAILALVALRYVVKYLPDFVHKTAASFHEIEQGRFVREQRRQLRNQIRHDEAMNALSAAEQNRLAEYLQALLEHEGQHRSAAQRFFRKYVRRVQLRLRHRDQESRDG